MRAVDVDLRDPPGEVVAFVGAESGCRQVDASAASVLRSRTHDRGTLEFRRHIPSARPPSRYLRKVSGRRRMIVFQNATSSLTSASGRVGEAIPPPSPSVAAFGPARRASGARGGHPSEYGFACPSLRIALSSHQLSGGDERKVSRIAPRRSPPGRDFVVLRTRSRPRALDVFAAYKAGDSFNLLSGTFRDELGLAPNSSFPPT